MLEAGIKGQHTIIVEKVENTAAVMKAVHIYLRHRQ